MGAVNILPLYLYDHSGITMNTTGFSCPWDSGRVGFIFAAQATILLCGTSEDKIEDELRSEVEVYDKYISE